MVLYEQQANRATGIALIRFLTWVLHDGRNYAAQMHYGTLPAPLVRMEQLQLNAPVPDSVRERAGNQLKQIEVTTQTITRSCEANLGLAKGSGVAPVRIDPATAGSLFSD